MFVAVIIWWRRKLDSIIMWRLEVLCSVIVRKGNLLNLPSFLPHKSVLLTCQHQKLPSNTPELVLDKKQGVLPFSFTGTQTEQLTYSIKWFSSYSSFFTNSCLNYPKNAQMWSGKWVLASKHKFAVHWAKNRWTCLAASLGLSHRVCQTHPWAAILTAKMEYINHKQSVLRAAALSPWPTLPLLLPFLEQLPQKREFLNFLVKIPGL